MPVESHPVHPSTQVGADHKPWCWNQPRPDSTSGYFVQERHYKADQSYVMVDRWIPFVLSTECRHDGLYSNCAGCAHIKEAK